MAEKICLISAFIVLAISSVSSLQTVNGRIHITTITTSACGDTVTFFRDHLVPTYEQYGEYIDLKIVPWGKTVNNGNGNLTCQFGVNDCWANRLHRCVLNLLEGNQKAQLDYMACELKAARPAYTEGSLSCVRATGLNLVDADYCVNNPGRDNLDEKAEAAATEAMAATWFVPTIFFNSNFVIEEHEQALTRLSSMVCFALANDPTTGIDSCQI